MKKCPLCAEEVQNESVKCKYFNSDITNVSMVKEGQRLLYCSFCHKSHKEVRKLVAGPEAYICNECIELCEFIIHEDKDTTEGAEKSAE